MLLFNMCYIYISKLLLYFNKSNLISIGAYFEYMHYLLYLQKI